MNQNIDEKVKAYEDEVTLTEKSELKEVSETLLSKKNLNKLTRLSAEQILNLIKLESIQATGILPEDIVQLPKKVKELNISRDGKGRDEIVALTQNERSAKKQTGFLSRVGNLFSKREK